MSVSVSSPSFGIFKQCHGALGNLSSFMFLCTKKRGGNIYKIIYCDTSIIVKACATCQHLWTIYPLPDAQPYVLGLMWRPGRYVGGEGFLGSGYFNRNPRNLGDSWLGGRRQWEGLVSWGLGILKDASHPNHRMEWRWQSHWGQESCWELLRLGL